MAKKVNRDAKCQKVFSKTDWFYKPRILTQMKCLAMFKHKRMSFRQCLLKSGMKIPGEFENKNVFTNVLIPLQNKLHLHLWEKNQTVSPILKWYVQNVLAGFEWEPGSIFNVNICELLIRNEDVKQALYSSKEIQANNFYCKILSSI